MIAIIDYGVGNLFSLKSSLKAIGQDALVTRDKDKIRSAEHVILPGVGAFGDAVEKLQELELLDFVKEQAATGKPFLGICLGMQLLFDRSEEYGSHQGLGLVKGDVLPLAGRIPENLDIPHMGWNALHFVKECPLFQGLNEGTYVYFVHSYAAFHCDADLAATAEYGIPVTAAVQHENVFGTQFHPEKSGEAGLRILKNFASL